MRAPRMRSLSAPRRRCSVWRETASAEMKTYSRPVSTTGRSPVKAAMSTARASAEASSGVSSTTGAPVLSCSAAANCARWTPESPVMSAGKPPLSPGMGRAAASGMSKNAFARIVMSITTALYQSFLSNSIISGRLRGRYTII